MKEDIVRLLRIVEYTGPRSWVERQLEKSIHGTKAVACVNGEVTAVATIKAATIGETLEILERGL